MNTHLAGDFRCIQAETHCTNLGSRSQSQSWQRSLLPRSKGRLSAWKPQCLKKVFTNKTHALASRVLRVKAQLFSYILCSSPCNWENHLLCPSKTAFSLPSVFSLGILGKKHILLYFIIDCLAYMALQAIQFIAKADMAKQT